MNLRLLEKNLMNVALVHESLITWGGADLVVQKFGEIYPSAPIYTALYDRDQVGRWFEGKEIITSFLQKFPWAIKKHRLFMPFYSVAFESFDLRKYDVVLSSHHLAAKSAITTADTCHICFVHTPLRFAWEFFPEYIESFGSLIRPIMRLFFHYFRMMDASTANRVDYFIANSRNTANRIRKHYRRESVVINSPVQAKNFRVADKTGDYYLAVSRLVPYKRIDIAVEAFNRLGEKLVVVGIGPEMKRLKNMAKSNIEFTGFRSGGELAELYSGCRAFIFPGEEDFGITPLEAQASGRPVIAYGAGGALETVIDNETGRFFHEQTPDALAETVRRFDPDTWDTQKIRQHAEKFDEEVFKENIRNFVSSHFESFKKESR